jgi:hypothetical protein
VQQPRITRTPNPPPRPTDAELTAAHRKWVRHSTYTVVGLVAAGLITFGIASAVSNGNDAAKKERARIDSQSHQVDQAQAIYQACIDALGPYEPSCAKLRP